LKIGVKEIEEIPIYIITKKNVLHEAVSNKSSRTKGVKGITAKKGEKLW